MDIVMKKANDFVKGLSAVFVNLLGLGILAGLLFGSEAMIGDVVGNITALITSLGQGGFVGLIVAILIILLLGESK